MSKRMTPQITDELMGNSHMFSVVMPELDPATRSLHFRTQHNTLFKKRVFFAWIELTDSNYALLSRFVVTMVLRSLYYGINERMPEINDLEPGELHTSDGEAVRRIPMSIAIDAGIIDRSYACQVEMRLLDKSIRDAKCPDVT